MNPYLLALIASVCFGVVVFPWQDTLKNLGLSGFMCLMGVTYFTTGMVVLFKEGMPPAINALTLSVGAITALLYVTALLLCSNVFARQGINTPVATAITAAYPIWTTLVSVLILGKRLTLTETIFLLMVVVGVVGLGLTTRPAQ